jgi:hypothetical protein
VIRDAVIDDIGSLVVLGERFFNTTEYSKFAEYSKESVIKTLEHLINSDDGILVVYDNDGIKGMAGALLYPFYMTGDLTGQELFWWCEEKGNGTALLDALESKARDKGAKTFTMISLDNSRPEILDKIYTKKRYNRSEHTYLKVF